MTGDFLPQRRKASVLSQLVTVAILLAAAAAAIWVFS
jgi:hypothetical protein